MKSIEELEKALHFADSHNIMMSKSKGVIMVSEVRKHLNKIKQEISSNTVNKNHNQEKSSRVEKPVELHDGSGTTETANEVSVGNPRTTHSPDIKNKGEKL